MTSGQTWWAAPVAGLLGVLITLFGTGRAQRIRMRDEANIAAYLEFWNACMDLYDLAVWSSDRSEAPVQARPLVDRIGRLGRAISYRGTSKVIRAARRVESEATGFASLVEDLRRDTLRGVGGELDERADSRFQVARAAFAEAIEAFGAASRRDVNLRGSWDFPS
ncbi:hypothetical protein [Actinoplanes sp. NPDC051851]|uniref:hypothetical protein n=1 Tax=Actinoplanes sp. NPDC051851 TaxID=3154753 RepID=UPI00343744A4